MRFQTTVKEFGTDASMYHLLPTTRITVIVEKLQNQITQTSTNLSDQSLPKMSLEERKRILDSIPNEYGSEDSEEWIQIITESRMNTDRLPINE